VSDQNGTVSWHAGSLREACAQTTSKVKVEGETSFDVAHCCNKHVLMRPARPFRRGVMQETAARSHITDLQ